MVKTVVRAAVFLVLALLLVEVVVGVISAVTGLIEKAVLIALVVGAVLVTRRIGRIGKPRTLS